MKIKFMDLVTYGIQDTDLDYFKKKKKIKKNDNILDYLEPPDDSIPDFYMAVI